MCSIDRVIGYVQLLTFGLAVCVVLCLMAAFCRHMRYVWTRNAVKHHVEWHALMQPPARMCA